MATLIFQLHARELPYGSQGANGPPVIVTLALSQRILTGIQEEVSVIVFSTLVLDSFAHLDYNYSTKISNIKRGK